MPDIDMLYIANTDQATTNVVNQFVSLDANSLGEFYRKLNSMIAVTVPGSIERLIMEMAVLGATKVVDVIESRIEVGND